MQGSLKVRPLGAMLKSDKDVVGKMDPYVVFELGKQKYQTAPALGMGLNPIWNEEFVFNVAGDDELTITIYDADKGKDDFLGKHTIRLSQLLHGGIIDNYFPLESRFLKSNEGNIHLRLEFTPIGQQGAYGGYQQKSYEQNIGYVPQPGVQHQAYQQGQQAYTQGQQNIPQGQQPYGQQPYGQNYPHKY